jgi:uncharacterized LabA/DUF88 family protein
MEGTIVFLDYGYLDKVSMVLNKGVRFKYDPNKFAHTLAKSQNLACKQTYYYVGAPYQDTKPTQEQKKRKHSYDKFVSKMDKVANFKVRAGRIQRLFNHEKKKYEYHQKGVDTLIIMDMIIEPFKRNIKKIIIVTADTDFVPVIDNIRSRGVKVILFYYTDRKRHSGFSMSNHLWSRIDKGVLLDKSYFEKSKYAHKQN